MVAARNHRSRYSFEEEEGRGIVTRCFRLDYLLGVMLILVAAASLSGCGVVAFPIRTASAAAKIVPVAGDVVAAPLDVTADAID
jgi:hypothetical protein